MFILAVLIGIYSYLIFALGLAGHLQNHYLLGLTGEFIVLSLFFVRLPKLSAKWSGLVWGMVVLLAIQAMINLIGALGPELGFDALWYHLTIPKIWIQEQRIYFIPDGRYYYSVMPKLMEMLYLPTLAVGSEIGAKLIHFSFGIMTSGVIFKLARKWLSTEYALLAVVLFYSNLVVGWQSITAYIDLGRTFFEVLAFYYLVDRKTYKAGIVLGLAVCTKTLALGSLPIFWILMFYQKFNLKSIAGFTSLAFLVASPWLVWAWLSTGNPIYPIFSELNISSVRLISDFISVFIRLPDPLNPIYLMVLPFVFWGYRKFPREVLIYCLLGLGVWFVLPRSGGGRFILPYLPVWSVLASLAMSRISDGGTRKWMWGMAFALAMVSVGYRGMANAKFVPFVLARESKQTFLDKYLNWDFGGNYYYWADPLAKP